MSTYHDTDFLATIYSEELYPVSEAEYDEVMRQAATSPDETEWQGYGEWSEEIESDAWAGAVSVETPNGEVLIKPECDRTGAHKACSIYKCNRAHREGGFDL